MRGYSFMQFISYLNNAKPARVALLPGLWNWIKAVAPLFTIGVLIGLFVWFTLPHPWIYNRLKPVPPELFEFWAILIGCAILSTRFTHLCWRFLLGAERMVYKGLNRRPFTTSLLLFGTSVFLFWFFRIRHIDSGDLYLFRDAALRDSVYNVGHAPVETLIRYWVKEIQQFNPNINLIPVYEWLSCVYGGFFVLAIFWLCSALPRRYYWFGPLLLLLNPVLELYCGYMEIYHFPLLTELIFLLVGIGYLNQRFSLTTVSLLFGFTVSTALWQVFMIPAYLFLLGYAFWVRKARIWEIALQCVITLCPFFCGLALFSVYSDPFLGIFNRMANSTYFIYDSPFAQITHYTLFCKKHLSDKANMILLIGLVGTIFIPARIMCGGRRDWPRWLKPDCLFLFLALLGASVLGFTYYPALGFPVDWDLFTFIFPCITLLGAAMMRNIFVFRNWKKAVLILVFLTAGLTSAWVLQNALFWRYPTMTYRLGPFFSYILPDFYYNQMLTAFQRNCQNNLYWIADEAIKESPDKYQEILKFMDERVVTTLAAANPEGFDLPGWACDLYIQPSDPPRVFVFDRYGRIFIQKENILKWVYAPIELIADRVVAAELDSAGDAILLTKNGHFFRVKKADIEKGITGPVVWKKPETIDVFLPGSFTHLKLPVHLTDLEINIENGHLCVLDNFNRVWDVNTKTVLLQGIPAYNAAVALHFTLNHQPITIDLNNHISYDSTKVRLPYETVWFYPIVRDFLPTFDDQGLMTLDLNGSVHYTGVTPLYENIPVTNVLIDRFIKIKPLYVKDSLVLLDNRYRLYTTPLDNSNLSVKARIQGLIDGGRLSQAYKHLREIWRKSSGLTEVCYDLVDTDFIRAARGSLISKEIDAIPIFVDAFPIRENLIVLLDRWGRLVYEINGKSFLLNGSGLTSWPHKDVIDGADADDRIVFLCTDGKVWEYPSIFALTQADTQCDPIPSLWLDLNDHMKGAQWIGIESCSQGMEITALTEDGLMLRFDLRNKHLIETIQLPKPEKSIFDFTCCDTPDGLAIAYTSQMGPAFLYSHWNGENKEVPFTKFTWQAVCDIQIIDNKTVLVMDRFGVVHPSEAGIRFYESISTPVADALALKWFQSEKKAVWLRNNGDRRIYRRMK